MEKGPLGVPRPLGVGPLTKNLRGMVDPERVVDILSEELGYDAELRSGGGKEIRVRGDGSEEIAINPEVVVEDKFREGSGYTLFLEPRERDSEESRIVFRPTGRVAVNTDAVSCITEL